MKFKNILISFLSGFSIALIIVVSLFSKKAAEAIKIKVRGRNNSVNLLKQEKKSNNRNGLIKRFRNRARTNNRSGRTSRGKRSNS